ncbi:uncharacterized protein MEPE_01460 [Melanopsichium pennsylvanicum]|uniref:Uncharacterized protein n=2 Tax=Melanopsichium pennsylvanicum TaxID=63383 RepID=A0AAJ5C3S0_9BASI|nr:putative protein [Melanopsichium pennsylvanicum 4]SNX82754.1 uncharacterized protein MEPE_01460 [Melanopsichium pennsylvanicum]
MSFSPLPAPGSAASSTIWARRMITKSVPTSSAEVELNVLSLLLDVPLASLDEQNLSTSPVSQHSPISPWTTAMPIENSWYNYRTPSPIAPPTMQLSMNEDSNYDGWEMHTAQTAVKAALDVLEEPSLSRGLRISTNALAAQRGCLTAPLSPALSSPVSPAESCFSGAESDTIKKKGRARMSQEKRKRLARRREREALVAALNNPQQVQAGDLQQYVSQSHNAAAQLSRSAPVTPIRPSHFTQTCNYNPGFPFSNTGYEAFSSPLSSPRGFQTDLPSPALTSASTAGFGSIGTPSSSPTSLAPLDSGCNVSSSPPTLVVQPPSPQRLRIVRPNLANVKSAQQQQQWGSYGGTSQFASVY